MTPDASETCDPAEKRRVPVVGAQLASPDRVARLKSVGAGLARPATFSRCTDGVFDEAGKNSPTLANPARMGHPKAFFGILTCGHARV